MSSAIQQLAAQLNRLEREVRAQATTPQLAYSSIEDGGSIDSNADDGSMMAQFGGQFDGSYMAASLVGPTPPTPSAPIVTPTAGGLIVRWDGLFTDTEFAPMDFSRVEIHVSTDPAFVPDMATTLVATIESPRGSGPFVALGAGVYYVAFVARSLSGAAGLESVTVGPVTAPPASARFSALVTNFGLSAGLNVLTSTTLTVPPGFTGAVILGTSRVFAYNNMPLGDYLSSRLYVPLSTTPPVTATLILPNGDCGTNHAPNSAVLTGLVAGDSIVLQLQAGTSTDTWTADSQNVASIDGIVIWTR